MFELGLELGGTGDVTSTYTSDDVTNVITIIDGQVPEDGHSIVFDADGIPSGLTPGTTYYVINLNGSTFQVSLTVGGAPIGIGDGGGILTIGPFGTGFIEGAVYVAGAHGYVRKISSIGTHISWHEYSSQKIWGLDIGPDGTIYPALGPIVGDDDFQPHDVVYLRDKQQLAYILARTNDTALIRVYDLDNTLVDEWVGVSVDSGWEHTTPLKIAVGCDELIAYYTDRGRTIFRVNLETGEQLSNYAQLDIDSPYIFADLDIDSQDRIIVNRSTSGNGPRNALALSNDQVVWIDRINPPDGIYKVYKLYTTVPIDILDAVVFLTPAGLNDEVTGLAAYYDKCAVVPPGGGLLIYNQILGA